MLIRIIFFLLLFANQASAFDKLRHEGDAPYFPESGGSIFTTDVSVERLIELPEGTTFFYSKDAHAQIAPTLYCYQYTMSHTWPMKIKFSFTEWVVIHSAFTKAVQDFSFTIAPDEEFSLRFCSDIGPSEPVYTDVAMLRLDGKPGVPGTSMSMPVALYLPDLPAALLEMVIN